MPDSPLANQLLDVAEALVNLNEGNPTQTSLRRSISASYYAMFHTICFNCANCIIPGGGEEHLSNAWRRSYRALSHSFAKNACITNKGNKKQVLETFPEPVQNFAVAFYTLQNHRHSADYDPYFDPELSMALTIIATARNAINDFEQIEQKHKQAFATLVLFQDRPLDSGQNV